MTSSTVPLESRMRILPRQKNRRGPLRVSNIVDHAKSYSGPHDAVIRVYDEAGNVIETHEHKRDFFGDPELQLNLKIPLGGVSAKIQPLAALFSRGEDKLKRRMTYRRGLYVIRDGCRGLFHALRSPLRAPPHQITYASSRNNVSFSSGCTTKRSRRRRACL